MTLPRFQPPTRSRFSSPPRSGHRSRDIRTSDVHALAQLAKLQGLQTFYLDMEGKRRDIPPHILRAVLGSLGTPAQTPDEARESLAMETRRLANQVLPPVVVSWKDRETTVPVRLDPGTRPSLVSCRLELEDGSHRALRLEPATARDRTKSELRLPDLPLGYHTLTLEHRYIVERALVISAPRQSYAPRKPVRDWGIFIPTYALHGADSWGAGNLKDWQELGRWVASLGGRTLATLPLLPVFLERPFCEPSPYSPVSRLFWNEFYLDIESLPEFAACKSAQKIATSAPFQKRLDRLRQAKLIDYQAEMRVRRAVLEEMARSHFRSGVRDDGEFRQFLRQRPEVEDYARFRAVTETSGLPWRKWEERLQWGKIVPSDFAEPALGFHLYVQWLAHRQFPGMLRDCSERGVKAYLDLPLGVHPDGYDSWRYRGVFAGGASTGAPPDLFFTRGQNWGFPPLHPQRLRESHYRYVREFLAFQLRHTGMLRIDHIMGWHRLYWIPEGAPAAEGAYVSYPAGEWFAIACLESVRHRALLVGENLGTVPPEVNRSMSRHQLRQMFVVQYVQNPAQDRLPPPPRECVASLNTHDMPAFAAHCSGADIQDRRALGLVRRAELRKKQAERRQAMRRLVRFLHREGLLRDPRPKTEDILRATLSWLARSRAELVLVNLEDLWGEPHPQNVPGTSSERPNWRRKARLSLEEIRASGRIREILAEINRWRTRDVAGRPGTYSKTRAARDRARSRKQSPDRIRSG